MIGDKRRHRLRKKRDADEDATIRILALAIELAVSTLWATEPSIEVSLDLDKAIGNLTWCGRTLTEGPWFRPANLRLCVRWRGRYMFAPRSERRRWSSPLTADGLMTPPNVF